MTRALLLSLSFLLALGVTAQAPAPSAAEAVRADDGSLVVRAPRVDVAPTLDGRLDDAAWAAARPADGFRQQTPQPGAAPAFQTEVRVVRDADALYVGARMHDSAPDSVVARLFRRDTNGYSDWFTVQIDSYDDDRSAFAFALNPRGVRRDYLLSNDTQQDDDWDAVWDGAAAVDADGWVAEIRIPLSQIRFQSGTPEWGINFTRRTARLGETSSWSPLSVQDDRYVSLFGTLAGVATAEPGRGLEVRPYAVTRATRAPVVEGNPFDERAALASSVGADLTYQLGSGLTVTATVNPDFGQVEADPSEVNLSAYETFFSERRPFFQEGTDIFQTTGATLFYSRRIGREPSAIVPEARYLDAPEASTILGATKLSGQVGDWSVGALSALTARESAPFVTGEGVEGVAAVEPATSYNVVRAQRRFRDGATTVGAIGTGVHRMQLDTPSLADRLPGDAVAGGVDVNHRFGQGTYQAFAAAFGSSVSGSAASIARLQRASARYYQRPDADHLAYDPERTRLSGVSALAGVSKIRGAFTYSGLVLGTSPGFELNDIGYLRQADQIAQEASVAYTLTQPSPAVRYLRLALYQSAGWTWGGEQTLLRLAPSVSTTFSSLWSAAISGDFRTGALDVAALRGGPALRTDPSVGVSGSVATDRRRPLRLIADGAADWRLGTTGRSLSAGLEASYRPAPNATLSLRLSGAHVSRPDQYVTTRSRASALDYVVGQLDQSSVSVTLRGDIALTPDLTVQLYAQPFLAAGRYDRFARVADPGARRPEDRYRALDATLDADGTAYAVDADADGTADYAIGRPDFSVAEMNTNAVLRWQYRPGSALFLVWSRGQSQFDPSGTLDPLNGFPDLFLAEPRDTVLLKLSYWFGG